MKLKNLVMQWCSLVYKGDDLMDIILVCDSSLPNLINIYSCQSLSFFQVHLEISENLSLNFCSAAT